MTPQQLQQSPQELEARVATLEAELQQVKQILSTFVRQDIPWWQKVAVSSENDPTFDEAVFYGREWRKSAENSL